MVYIQSDIENKLPHHFDAACGLYGALDNSQNIRLTSLEEIQSGKFDNLIKQHLFIGSVEFMTEVFNRVGKIIEPMLPSQTMTKCKLIEAKEKIIAGNRYFLKPVQTKLFSGMVYDAMSLSNLSYPDDTEIWLTTPFKNKIISEWRCYIRFNQIIDSRNYSGNFKCSPDYNFADNILKLLKNYPSAFTMDLGILDNGETTVIEYNDMWAIGNYGIDNNDYYKLLRERYFEIMRSY